MLGAIIGGKLELKQLVNYSAKNSVETVLFAFLNTEDYEDCIRQPLPWDGTAIPLPAWQGELRNRSTAASR